MGSKILFVDDEAAVLSGYSRALRSEFQVETALGGELGLKAIADTGPYEVVVSDMRMPEMSGAEFLGRARDASPEMVRILLTGNADMLTAIEAVNEGNIFRFLTKPCPKEALVEAIHAGVEQHRLIRAEKDLLEQTLMGCIKVLADFLGASNPEAFARSARIAHCVRHIASRFRFEFPWRLDAAATLSQLGCVTLDPEVMQRVLTNARPSPEDEARFSSHPETAMRILSRVPRLETVAWMIGQQLKREIPEHYPVLPAESMRETVLGAKILKLAVAYDGLRMTGLTEEAAVRHLRMRTDFEKDMLAALDGLKAEGEKTELRKVQTAMLAVGMILEQEIRNNYGLVLFVKGQTVTAPMQMKLVNFASAGLIDREVMAQVPVA